MPQKIAAWGQVSFKQFESDYPQEYANISAREAYDALKEPARATAGSAGYDFYAPFDITLKPGETIKVPTGFRASMLEDWALFLFPRSGLGFKFRMQLNNTVGIVDSDYFYADNEGHIMAKITNDTNEGKIIEIKQGQGFIQGVFMQYGIVEFDNATETRHGGFGSTTK